jgi:hypothetical protein
MLAVTGLTNRLFALFFVFAALLNTFSFGYLFYQCVSLTSIPNMLFDNNKNISSFQRCFYGIKTLTGSTPSGSDGLKLWERSGKPGYPGGITGTGCFYGATRLEDYSAIPYDWVKQY